MVVRVALLTIVAVLLAGCSGDDDGPRTGSGPTPAAASTEPVIWRDADAGVALLSDVRATAEPGHDRVVFEFENGIPGFEVGYRARPIVADGSGDEVPIDGRAVLVVRMEPALDSDLTQESAPRTYTGPTRLSPETAAVVELVRTGGFEAVLAWAIGVDDKRPFRVTRLDDPARIVIDIASS